MQSDDVTWSIINKSFCSYKLSSGPRNFCRNEYNLTGLCSRAACPLANTQYATVREERGVCYLYIRTAERAFFPLKQWEKVKLSKNFPTALRQINTHLLFWKKFFKVKCRQRLLKITQYLSRMRKLKLNAETHINKILIPKQTRVENHLKRREQKAFVAARIDNAIEKTLLQRLKEGTYEGIYNFPTEAFEIHTKESEQEKEVESYATGSQEEEEELESIAKKNPERVKVMNIMRKEVSESEEEDEDFNEEVEYVADFEESDYEDMDIEEATRYVNAAENESEDDSSEEEEEIEKRPKKKMKRSTKPVVHVEYDEEDEEEPVREPVKIRVRH